jgi:hypothetical protein
MKYLLCLLLLLGAGEAGAIEGVAIDKQGKPVYPLTLPAMTDNHGNEVRTACEVTMEAASKAMDEFIEQPDFRWSFFDSMSMSCDKECLKKKLAEIERHEAWEARKKMATKKWTAAKACWRTP